MEAKKLHELSINDLKALGYDKIAEIDHYNAAINQVRNELQKINQQIEKQYVQEQANKPKEATTVTSEKEQ